MGLSRMMRGGVRGLRRGPDGCGLDVLWVDIPLLERGRRPVVA